MPDLLSDAEFEMFRKVIYDESGITFSGTNRSVLDSRIRELLRQKKLDSVAKYYTLILQNKEEMKEMLDSVTTNLTHFFRTQPHFDALINYVVPHLIDYKKQHGSDVIRVWSAGCSTGEEPYTIAMILKTILPPPFTFKITASDI
ncbi:MAG: CheR family methyltransferase, partial [Treponema socranskii subsp. buccale]